MEETSLVRNCGKTNFNRTDQCHLEIGNNSFHFKVDQKRFYFLEKFNVGCTPFVWQQRKQARDDRLPNTHVNGEDFR
jgi:hypothetical protein